jgi:hypothetical protein
MAPFSGILQMSSPIRAPKLGTCPLDERQNADVAGDGAKKEGASPMFSNNRGSLQGISNMRNLVHSAVIRANSAQVGLVGKLVMAAAAAFVILGTGIPSSGTALAQAPGIITEWRRENDGRLCNYVYSPVRRFGCFQKGTDGYSYYTMDGAHTPTLKGYTQNGWWIFYSNDAHEWFAWKAATWPAWYGDIWNFFQGSGSCFVWRGAWFEEDASSCVTPFTPFAISPRTS